MAHVQVEGKDLKAVGSICEKAEDTGDKHKAFVHVFGRNNCLILEASNGAVVVRMAKAVEDAEGIACVIPKGTIGRIRGKDEVFVERAHRGAHKLHVEKETDRFERTLEGDQGGEKGLADPFPDLNDKFADLPLGSGGYDVHPDNLRKAAALLSAMKCNRVTLRLSKRKGSPYVFLVGYSGDDKTVHVAVGSLDMFGAPEAEEVAKDVDGEVAGEEAEDKPVVDEHGDIEAAPKAKRRNNKKKSAAAQKDLW